MLAVRPKFHNIVNGAVLVVCLILGTSATIQIVDRVRPQPDAVSGTGARTYQAGDVLPALKDYSYSNAEATLVLAVRSTCGFCTQSMPFYGRLIDDVKRANRKIKIVAVSTDSTVVLQRYFESHGIALESLRTVSAGYLRIVGTPTILLADSSGVVKTVWIGLLDPAQEAAVLSVVTNVGKRS